MKVSAFAVSAFALMLILAGFVVGWTLGYQQPQMVPAQGVAEDMDRSGPKTAEPTMPSEDEPGDDISGLPRYPGAVRIEHAREDLGGIISTEIEYLTPTEIDTVRGFYRDAFRTEDWRVADVNFSEGAWTFFVTQDEREVFVEIKPYGGLTEVDFEMTEPKPDEAPPENQEEQEPQEEPQGEQQKSEPSREPGPQPAAPASSASATASPAPASVPAYDDDDGYEEDDFDGED